MSSAITLRNVVGKTKHIFIVGIVPPKRQFDRDTVTFRLQINWCINQRLFSPVQIADKLLQATFIKKFGGFGLRTPGVGQDNTCTRVQKRQFTQTMFQPVKFKFHIGERF